MRIRRFLWPVVGGLFAGVILVPSAGHADAFPGNADTAVADSSLTTYCYTSGFDTDKSVASYAVSVLSSTTDMSHSYQGDPCIEFSIDAWWWEFNLPGGLRGQRSCYQYSAADVCDSSDLVLDYGQLDIGSDDWEDRRKTAVHELGHSIGLNHDNESAMISGEIPSTALKWRRYSAHDIGHINACY